MSRYFLALFVFGSMIGCASIPADDILYGADALSVEITETPFFPQQQYQCGPAALQTVLAHSGAQTSIDDVIDRVFLPGRKGSLQVELLAATRANGRVPYLIEPQLHAVMEELEAGRPVLVLQNLGVNWAPRWHYAVVVGIDPDNDAVILRSGTDRRRIIKTNTFIRTWRRSDSWAFVALRPGELPARPDPQRYFNSVAGVEATGHSSAARKAWQTAFEHWPNEPVALFGLANAELAAENYAVAERYYRTLLGRKPGLPIAKNNLALALSRQGKHDEALLQINAVLMATDPSDPLLEEYRSTLAEIDASALESQ